ncbi:MAG: flagellar hook capping FlgD N-terminal domain-containing protein [Planctomycetota bacterium]
MSSILPSGLAASAVDTSAAGNAPSNANANANAPGGQSNAVSSANESVGGGFNDLDLEQFLGLMLAELQNQDPLDPMDNSELIQQIAMLREVTATDQLSQTLGGLQQSQELVTASGLIGKSITGLSDDGSDVSGSVERVTVETGGEAGSRTVRIHVDGNTISLDNVREITPSG